MTTTILVLKSFHNCGCNLWLLKSKRCNIKRVRKRYRILLLFLLNKISSGILVIGSGLTVLFRKCTSNVVYSLF